MENRKGWRALLFGRKPLTRRRAAFMAVCGVAAAAVAAFWDDSAPTTDQPDASAHTAPRVSADRFAALPRGPDGLPRAVDLPIANIAQQTQVWCWAAVAQQIIAATRGEANTPPQCALVAIANGADSQACCAGQNPQCVRTGSLQQIQDLISRYGGRSSAYAPPTDEVTLYNTLARGRAVIIGVQTAMGTGHVVVARGMSFAATPQGPMAMIHINDPMAHFTQPVPFGQIAQVWREAIVVN